MRLSPVDAIGLAGRWGGWALPVSGRSGGRCATTGLGREATIGQGQGAEINAKRPYAHKEASDAPHDQME